MDIEAFGTSYKKYDLISSKFDGWIYIYPFCELLIGISFLNYSLAHMRGTFLSEEEAEKRSLELGCEGIHKNQDKWMPCKNEKELHIYLRK